MSLRTNLATRPFYNERAVQVLLVIAAIIVAAVTAFNVRQLYALTAKDRALVTAAEAAEDKTRSLSRDIARTRTGIDAAHVADVSAAAHEPKLRAPEPETRVMEQTSRPQAIARTRDGRIGGANARRESTVRGD